MFGFRLHAESSFNEKKTAAFSKRESPDSGLKYCARLSWEMPCWRPCMYQEIRLFTVDNLPGRKGRPPCIGGLACSR